ncbi:CheR family methyltransferase [Rheinheimera sp. SA_1]|uniref:CheR family methyltransferase n=1 Tax=Rheinheimera sp. SA_1 TaxID=1827365 RepID=UPI0008309CDC|nr:CheR family methyltransferase [Rheinheimera sp. SA_1]
MNMPAIWLDQIIEKAGQHFGLLFQQEQSADLLCRLKLRAQELQKDDELAWIQQVAQAEWSLALQHELLPALTVGETYFCRDPFVTQWLIQNWLPKIQSSQSAPVRIWSAGCCRGEEAYSLLFLLSEALDLAQMRCGLNMVATDLNPEFIAKAEQGIYRATSFRNGTGPFRQRYFSVLSPQHSWQVKPQWRALIKFQTLNLMDSQPHPAGPFDLIFCRNVLMYFSPEQAHNIITRFLQQLNPGGLLLLNAVEASIATQSGYHGFWAVDNYAVPASALAATALAPSTFVPSTRQAKAEDLSALPTTQQPAIHQPVIHQPTLPRLTAQKQTTTLPLSDSVQQATATATTTTTPVQTGTRPRAQPQADYYLQQAKKSADLQQPEQARRWLTQLLELTPDSAAGHLLSAQLYRQELQPQLALQALQKVLYLEPDLIVAHLLRATLSKEIGQQQTALKELQLCTQLLQHYPSALEIPYSDQLSAGQLYLICQQLVAEMSE